MITLVTDQKQVLSALEAEMLGLLKEAAESLPEIHKHEHLQDTVKVLITQKRIARFLKRTKKLQ